MPRASLWIHMTDVEREAHFDKIEKFWLDDVDTNIQDCRRRFLFPSVPIISKMLKDRNSHAKKGKRTSSEEMRRSLGNMDNSKVNRGFNVQMNKIQGDAKKLAIRKEGNYYIPRDEVQPWDE